MEVGRDGEITRTEIKTDKQEGKRENEAMNEREF